MRLVLWAASALIAMITPTTASRCLASVGEDSRDAFVRVEGSQFLLAGKPYHYVGTNFWYGMNLASAGTGGDQARLRRELDHLQTLGVTNLRIMASSEGPNTAPYRMRPALQPAPGIYDEAIYRGLDLLLVEMRQRGMRGVLCLSDFWQWSGGFPQYVSWAEGGSAIPYPDHGDWDQFEKYSARFFVNSKAKAYYDAFVDKVVGRVNSLTGQPYRDDPTIMAWQLANEPRGMDHPLEFVQWVKDSSNRIRSLDHNHLISTGSEGSTPSDYANTLPEVIHALPNIDYLTFHIWIQNWGWYDPQRSDTYGPSLGLAHDYIAAHVAIAERLHKPAVLEEFGIARDQGSFQPAATVRQRDAYYRDIFSTVYASTSAGSALNGINFWAWAGEGRPVHVGGTWQPGDAWIGDPPHEPQGWYSVYNEDVGTIAIIRDYAQAMQQVQPMKETHAPHGPRQPANR